MISALARRSAFILAACFLVGAAPPPPKAAPPPKPPVVITLENLGTLEGGKLFGDIISFYLTRDYKGKKDREAAVASLEYLAPVLDDLPRGLRYSFVDGKPRILFDARVKVKNAEAEQALRGLVAHCFLAVAKDGYQAGPDAPRYVIGRDLVAPLAASVVVLWRPEADPKQVERIRLLEAQLRKAEEENAQLRERLGFSETQRNRLLNLLAKREATIKNLSAGGGGAMGGRAGAWVPVCSWAVDCCGRWYPVARWYFVGGPAPAEKSLPELPKPREGAGDDLPAGKKRVAARADDEGVSRLPLPLDTTTVKPGDASKLFWKGYEAFHGRDYASAWQKFEAATRMGPGDARYWYYRALAERALGDTKAAEASRQAGIKAEKRLTRADDLAYALERIQGERRVWLRLGDSGRRAD